MSIEGHWSGDVTTWDGDTIHVSLEGSLNDGVYDDWLYAGKITVGDHIEYIGMGVDPIDMALYRGVLFDADTFLPPADCYHNISVFSNPEHEKLIVHLNNVTGFDCQQLQPVAMGVLELTSEESVTQFESERSSLSIDFPSGRWDYFVNRFKIKNQDAFVFSEFDNRWTKWFYLKGDSDGIYTGKGILFRDGDNAYKIDTVACTWQESTQKCAGEMQFKGRMVPITFTWSEKY